METANGTQWRTSYSLAGHLTSVTGQQRRPVRRQGQHHAEGRRGRLRLRQRRSIFLFFSDHHQSVTDRQQHILHTGILLNPSVESDQRLSVTFLGLGMKHLSIP